MDGKVRWERFYDSKNTKDLIQGSRYFLSPALLGVP